MKSRGKPENTEVISLDSPSEIKIQSTVKGSSSASSSQDGDLEKGWKRTQAIDNEDPNLVSHPFRLNNRSSLVEIQVLMKYR
jgi:hypothetical protein